MDCQASDGAALYERSRRAHAAVSVEGPGNAERRFARKPRTAAKTASPDQQIEIVPGNASAVRCILDKPEQAARCGDCVPGSAMSPGNLDAVVVGDMVERAAWKLGKNLSRQFHGAQSAARRAAGRTRGRLRRR